MAVRDGGDRPTSLWAGRGHGGGDRSPLTLRWCDGRQENVRISSSPLTARGRRPSVDLVPLEIDALPASAVADLDLPERLSYRVKRRLLGPPLTNDQLKHERLSKFLALGVLAPDCISSSAYGTEQILTALLPAAALGAFVLVLPITGVVIAILVLLTICYRQVVSVYTRAGGSYVVARENFGPRVAQIAAVALLIDYVVTVAVQTAAGTVAVVSAVPRAGPLQPGDHRRSDLAAVLGQPARYQGGRQGVRIPHVLLRAGRRHDDRRRHRAQG